MPFSPFLFSATIPLLAEEVAVRKHYRKIKRDGKTYQEHRLVMEGKLGRRLKDDEVVHHVNGDIHDNRPKNLEVTNRREHAQHHLTQRFPTAKRGERGEGAKLTREQVIIILKRADKGEALSNIARDYGVDRRVVSRIRHRQHWRHISAFWPLRAKRL